MQAADWWEPDAISTEKVHTLYPLSRMGTTIITFFFSCFVGWWCNPFYGSSRIVWSLQETVQWYHSMDHINFESSTSWQGQPRRARVHEGLAGFYSFTCMHGATLHESTCSEWVPTVDWNLCLMVQICLVALGMIVIWNDGMLWHCTLHTGNYWYTLESFLKHCLF